jgi:hypothetical protein
MTITYGKHSQLEMTDKGTQKLSHYVLSILSLSYL